MGAERERAGGALRELGLRVLRSDANSLLFFVPDAAHVHARLADMYGIVVRRRDIVPGLAGVLRVTTARPRQRSFPLRTEESTLAW